MSIAAMHWAWQLRLRPTLKFVLMALADASDDNGYCWPSVPTLAKKTCLDDRSVQRVLKKLKADGLVLVEQRFRKDGSRTSNGYRLALTTPGDKSSPPVPEPHRDVVAPPPPASGSYDTQTTTEHHNESSLQRANSELAQGGGGLIYPKQLTTKEISLASKRLARLSTTLAQEVLDELAGRLNAYTVRGSPLSYLRSLIERAEAGNFMPEIGVRVAAAREREKELVELRKSDPPSRPVESSTNPSEYLEEMRKMLAGKPISIDQE